LRRARFIVTARRYVRAHDRLECVRTNGSYIGYRDTLGVPTIPLDSESIEFNVVRPLSKVSPKVII